MAHCAVIAFIRAVSTYTGFCEQYNYGNGVCYCVDRNFKFCNYCKTNIRVNF